MDIHQTDALESENPVIETPDEFASGPINAPRRLFIRLVGWFTKPGYLPSELIWFLSALIATDLICALARQPRGYWIDPSISNYLWFFDIPFNLGPWVMLGICAAYILVLHLLLTFLNSKPALVIWVIFSILHMQNMSLNFACHRYPSFPFINLGNCGAWLFAVLLVEAVTFGLMLVIAVKFHAIPLMQHPPEATDPAIPAWSGRINWGAIVWISAAFIAFLVMAFSPQSEWQLIQPQNVPPPRAVASVVHNPLSQKAVLFGGAVLADKSWIDLNDTWEWDGKDWQQLNPSNSPTPRRSAAAIYDENNGVTLLFGGGFAGPTGQFITLNDTWTWDGTNWVQLSPSNQPSARMCAAIYYDPLEKKVFLYGGYSYNPIKQETKFYNDAWSWDGKTWSEVALVTPKVVYSGNMLFDPEQQIPLMIDNDGIWSITNQEWFQPDFSVVPVGRSESQMAFDSVHGQTILFGGYREQDKFNDTWAFDGTQWTKVLAREGPSKRTGHSLFFDALRGKIVLFGGYDGKATLNDMWELRQP